MKVPMGNRRRTLLLGLIALMLLADGALLGALVSRRSTGRSSRGHDSHPIDWSHLAATDLRIAGAFGALEREGLDAALDVLSHAAAQDSVVLRDGHQLAHTLGRLAVTQRGDGSVIKDCRPDFASGCYHGVVEAFIQSRGRVDMGELQQLCAGAGSELRPGPVYECMHGLGHGVMGAVGLDLGTALRDCDALRLDFADWCRSGAFMEAMQASLGTGPLHVHTSHAGMHPGHMDAMASLARQFPLNPADPYSPCDRFADPYGSACWVFQGFIILQRGGFEPAAALRMCDRAPADRIADCYESIGLQITGPFQRDEAWIVRECARGKPELAAHCAAGAARALVQIDWSGLRAARLCAAAPAAWRDGCYRTTGRLLAALASPAERTALCDHIESKYSDTCRRAAALDRGT